MVACFKEANFEGMVHAAAVRQSVPRCLNACTTPTFFVRMPGPGTMSNVVWPV